jgi:uncharacterized protein (TIGR02145 family)
MITPAIRYISSFQDATNSSSITVPTPLMVDGRVWDQKNLNVSTYRSGRVIPQVKTGWSTLTTGAWRYYNDNPASAAVYGRLYNWYALMGIYDAASLADPSLRDNIAPVDWDVATYGEWITLRNILGRSTAAIALKESGPAHWGPTNTGTNSSYFTALPGGYKTTNNTSFNRLGSVGYWWPKDATGYFYLNNTSNSLGYYSTTTKRVGFSIRLIKPTTVIPGFETTYPTTITSTSLLGTGGDIPTSYSGTITERGIVYGTTINPTIANTKIQSGTGTGSYTINITGLSVNTEYFIRAYAISSIDGIVYANNISVFTLNSTPTVFTNITSQITTNSALSGGYIDNDGGLAITAKGVVWSTSPNPTVALATKTNNGGGIEAFVSEITGLSLNTKYYVRAYATNSGTTGYGQQEEFTTLAVPSFNLIFNQYIAHHAYSLRKLSDTYDYRCVRVRRTTAAPNPVTTTIVDVFFNSYSEIGLNNDILYISGTNTLATTLGEFADGTVDGLIAPSSIFVVTWYDQSGNGKNLTNSTAGQQPRLVYVDAGVAKLETSNGQVAVRFIKASNNVLQLNDTTANINNMSSYFVGAFVTNVGNNIGYGLSGGGANRFYFPFQASNIFAGYSSSLSAITLVTGTTTNRNLYELISPSPTNSLVAEGWTNGVSKGTFALGSGATAIIQLGTAGTNYYDGHIQEVIGFQSNAYRVEKEINIMDYYGIQRLPLVTTADVNYIEPTGTAIGGGNLIDDFGLTTTKGVCWDINTNPTANFTTKTVDGTGIGAFTSNLTFLRAYTQYYARAYAENSAGVSYGQEKQFITTEVAPTAFILDLFPSAHHAFSLRRLRTAYTGFCIRVRRTNLTPNTLSTTVDVSFNSLNTIGLDSTITFVSGAATTAVNLGQFCASIVQGYTNPDGVNTNQDIFISTWFDQSGNNKNVVSTTTTQQPRIVSAGNLETKDGKAAVRFIRTSITRLLLIDTTMNINNLAQYIVTSLITTNVVTNSSTFRYTTNAWWLPVSNGTNTYISYNSSFTHLSNVNDTANRLYSLVAGPTTYNAYSNTTNIGTGPSVSNSSQWIVLGFSGGAASNALDGYIQESITWQNQSNVGEIQSIIRNYYGI